MLIYFVWKYFVFNNDKIYNNDDKFSYIFLAVFLTIFFIFGDLLLSPIEIISFLLYKIIKIKGVHKND